MKTLLAELAPDGVPYRRLGDLGSLGSTRVATGVLDPSTYVGVDNLLANFGGRRDAGNGVNSSGAVAFEVGDILIGNIRPYLKKVWLADRSGGASPDVLVLSIDPAHRDSLLPRFLYFAVASERFIDYSMKHAKGAKMPRGSKAAVLDYRVPVPPLAVQREVVRILDHFTELEAELEAELQAELEARMLQYEHYRLEVLGARSTDAKAVPLGEAIRIKFGTRITKAKDGGSAFPVYGGGGESFRTDDYNREDEWVVSRFAMSENCVRRVPGKFWLLDSGFSFEVVSEDLDKDFIGQVLLSMQPTIFATSTQSAQKNIDIEGFKRLRIRVPSVSEQRDAVQALDKFDALINDLSIGLPAELAARRKQYEYYRDKLLTFEEAPA